MERRLIPLSEVKSEPVRWLWPNRVAYGAVTLLEGDPGVGKSSVAYDITARTTSGRPMFNCRGCPSPGNVILLTGEDSLSKCTRPNLRAAGAAISRILVFDKKRFGGRSLLLPDDLSIIEAEIGNCKARLLVIDPVSEFLGVDTNNERAVRKALTPLSHVAERTGAAVLLVRHLRKSHSGNPLYRGVGSIAFVGVSRSVLLAAPDPCDLERRVLVQTKNNLGPLAVGLSYEPAEKNGALVVKWIGESALAVGDLVASSQQGHSELQEAIFAMYSILAEGPVAAKDALKMASEAGIAPRTTRRAKKALGITSKRVGFGKLSKFFWQLPEPNDLLKQLKDHDMTELLDRLTYGSTLDEEMEKGSDENEENFFGISGPDAMTSGGPEDVDPADWWKLKGQDDGEELEDDDSDQTDAPNE